MARAFAVEAIFKAIDRFTGPVDKMAVKTESFGKRVSKNFSSVADGADKVVRGIDRIGVKAAAASVAMGAIGVNIISVGAEFDSTMVKAVAKLDPALKRGSAGFETMKQLAKDIGAQTEFNALQAAKGIDAYASAGMNHEQIMAALPKTVDFATIAEVPDLGVASGMITGALSGFDLMTKDTEQLAKNVQRVSDTIAKTVIATSAGAPDLAEAIARAGTITTQAGQSPETFLAMAGILSPLEKGEKAGTTIKNILDPFTSDGKDRSGKLLKSIHVKTLDAKGDMRDVLDILADIGKATEKMGTGTKTGFLKKLFGEVPAAGAMKLLQDPAAIKALRKEIEGAAGASKELAGAFRDTVTGDIDAFTSAVDDVKLSIFDLNQGPLRGVLQSMTKWVAANKDLILQKVQDTVGWIADNFEKIVTWGERIGAVIGAIYAIDTASKIATLGVEGVKLAVKGVELAWGAVEFAIGLIPGALRLVAAASRGVMIAVQLAIVGVVRLVALLAANPIGLIAIAIAAAVAAIIYFWPEISAFFIDLWDSIKELAAYVSTELGPVWEAAASEFIEHWTGIGDMFVTLWDALTSGVESTVDYFTSAWGGVAAWFTSLWEGIVNTATSAIDAISTKVAAVSSALGFGDSNVTVNHATDAPTVRSTGNMSLSHTVQELRTVDTAEITIKTDPGVRAEVTKKPIRSPIALQNSGAF